MKNIERKLWANLVDCREVLTDLGHDVIFVYDGQRPFWTCTQCEREWDMYTPITEGCW